MRDIEPLLKRARELGVDTTEVVDRAIAFAEEIAQATDGFTEHWLSNLRAYILGLLAHDADIATSSDLQKSIASVSGETVPESLTDALRRARWNPMSAFSAVGRLAGQRLGFPSGWLIDELVLTRHVTSTSFGRHAHDALDRVDGRRASYRDRWSRKISHRQRALMTLHVGASGGALLALRPAGVQGQPLPEDEWEAKLVESLNDEATDECATAVVLAAHAAAPHLLEPTPRIGSAMVDQAGWCALRRELQGLGIPYVLPVPRVPRGGDLLFVFGGVTKTVSEWAREASPHLVVRKSRPWYRAMHGVLPGGDTVSEWLVIEPELTVEGHPVIWVLSRPNGHHHLDEDIPRRLDFARKASKQADVDLFASLHANAWSQQRASSWLRHLAIVAIAHAFVSVERAPAS